MKSAPRRFWMLVAVGLAGCSFEPGNARTGDPARVAPFALELSAHRVVLTPGGHDVVRIELGRTDDDDHPVLLQLDDSGAGDLAVTLDDHVTRQDVATLSLTAPVMATTHEVTLAFRARLGPYEEREEVVVSVQVPGDPRADTEQFEPGVVGVPHTAVLGGELVHYQVIDGIAVANGDIVLGDAAEVEARSGLRTVTCNYGFHTDFNCSPWTDGVIGYRYADDWGSDAENARMHAIIESAMAEWASHTGIRFVRRSAGEFLEFRNGDGCSSNLGRAIITGFDVQAIQLSNNGCDDTGRAMHEIGHAIGLYHEQSRNDRDSFVVVDFGRVQDGMLDQFFQWGEASRDHGAYDYDSIMHYERSAFARNKAACDAGDLSECTIRPDDPTAHIGQRLFLSEGDILGAYELYPPQYRIEGATEGQSGDRFFLSLDFSTPAPRGDRIMWTSSLSSSPIGAGTHLDLRASDVPSGPQVITASFIVAGVTVTSRSIALNVTNHAPTVTLMTTNGSTAQEASEVFSVTALVSDPEDGTCPPGTCRYTWSPEPTTGPADSQTASFSFYPLGPQVISVTVEDRGGVTVTSSITVDIVDTPPVATILRPSTPSVTIPEGVALTLEGMGTDRGLAWDLPCFDLYWSSSNAADDLSFTRNCSTTVTFAGAGTRTITLVAVDGRDVESAPATVEVDVTSCAGDCAPTAFLAVSAPDWEVSGVAVHGIDRAMQLHFDLGDAEAPADNPVHYRLTAQRSGEPTIGLGEGDVIIPDPSTEVGRDISWTPGDDLSAWSECDVPAGYRAWDLVLEVRDAAGQVTTTHQGVTLGCTFL